MSLELGAGVQTDKAEIDLGLDFEFNYTHFGTEITTNVKNFGSKKWTTLFLRQSLEIGDSWSKYL